MTYSSRLASKIYITVAVVLGLMMAVAGSALAQDGKTGAGDDQQVPDNLQSGGGGTVTKTFELTINGTVPEGDSFYVQYLEEGQTQDLTSYAVFCGELIEEEPKPACEGDGAVYTIAVQFDAGTTLDFRFGRHNQDYTEIEVFHEGTETLVADVTNSAFYTYGKGTGAGDDQQDDKSTDTGAGDDQQVPDNQQSGDGKDTDTGAGDDQQGDTQDDGAGAGDDQQDDTQDDVQDDQQGEMPDELPDTGAGGLAGGVHGGLAAALGLLAAATALPLRRR